VAIVLSLVAALGPVDTAHAQSLIPTKATQRSKGILARACSPGASLICAGSELVGAAGDVAGDVLGAGVEAAGGAVFGGLASWAGEGAAWLVDAIGKRIDRSTRPELGSAWFGRQYRTTASLALSMSIIFVLLAVIQATLRQDAAMLARSVFVALPLAMLLTFACVTLVEAALGVTDWMTSTVLGGFRAGSREAFSDLAEILVPASATGSPLPGFLLFLSAIVTALLSLLVWLELVMREAATYVAVSFLPLTFVAMVWRETAHWCRKLAGWLLAIIASKFTIASAFALAAGAIGDARGGATGGLSALLAGCAVLLLAALTPWVILAIVPFGDAAQGRSLHRGTIRQASHSVPGALAAGMVVRQAMVRNLAPAGAAAAAGRPPGGAPGSPASSPPVAAVARSTPAGEQAPQRYASIATTSPAGSATGSADRSEDRTA
jgi:hypothetical protein